MSTRPDTGFTLIEMIVTIVLTAILMAMAAPLIAHLVDGYVAGAQGADLASAVGPALSRMQWDGRNAYQMQLTNGCVLELEDVTGRVLEQYRYAAGQLFRNNVLILGDLHAQGCPFGLTPWTPYVVTYNFVYAGPGGQGQLSVEGALSAYGL